MVLFQRRRFAKRRSPRRLLAAAGLAVLAPAFATGAAHATASSSDCTAANAGALDVVVPAAGAVTRQLALDAGDIVNVSLNASVGGTGSITLVGGLGAPQTLIEGSSAAAATFRAPQSETYSFRLAAEPQGTATVKVRCTSASVAAADAAFLARRKDILNSQDPDRIRIDRAPAPIANPDKPLGSSVAVDAEGRPKDVAFSVSMSEIAAAAEHSGKKPEPGLVDFWVEGRMRNYDVDGGETDNGNLGVLYLGTSSKIGSDIKTGALVQLDRGIETERYGRSELAATGWMAGPYVSMRLGSGVVFDGRAAWGETENAIASGGIRDGQIERELVRAKLTGTRQVQGWSVAPSLGLIYVEDAVRDAESGEMKAAGTGKVEVLPEVSRRFALDGDTFVEPRAALGGYVGFDEFSKLNAGSEADLHLKAEAGVAVGVKDGSTLQATGGVESSEVAVPESWSGRLQLNVPLGK